MASENLQVVASQSSHGQKIFSLKGPVTIDTVVKLQDALRSEASLVLILDFTEVPFIDTSGVGALVAVHVGARKSDRKILFAAFNSQARAVLELMHLNQVFPTYHTIRDAEAAARA
jgi:anti-sigma B factor antagonist